MKKRQLFSVFILLVFLFSTSVLVSSAAEIQTDLTIQYGKRQIAALRYGDESVRYYTFADIGTADWVYYTDDFLTSGDRAEFSKDAAYFAVNLQNTTSDSVAFTFQPATAVLNGSEYQEGATYYIGKNAVVYLVDGTTGVRSMAAMFETPFSGRYCYEIPAGFSGWAIVSLDALSANPNYDAAAATPATSDWNKTTKVFSRFSFWLTAPVPTGHAGIANGAQMIKGTALIQGALPEYEAPSTETPDIDPVPTVPQTGEVPKTGDSGMALSVGMLLLTAAGLYVAICRGKRKNTN